jgi:plastocyanin
MNKSMTLLKYGIGATCFVFLLPGCKSTAETILPKKHTVEIKAMKFQPAELIVSSGDTVVWINRDIVPHDVTEDPGRAWTSSLIPTGASWSFVVTKSADYYCSIHVVMKGKLLVQ